MSCHREKAASTPNPTVDQAAVAREIAASPEIQRKMIRPHQFIQQAKSYPIRPRLNRIVIPRIEFDHVALEEAIDFLRLRCAELDPDPDPAHRGISMLTKQPKTNDKNTTTDSGIAANSEAIKITYSAEAVPILVALAEIARQAHLDIYLTEVGIVICQIGDPPFPNDKAEKGEVWETL